MKKQKKYWLYIAIFTFLCSCFFPSSKTTISYAKTYQLSTTDIAAKADMFVDASLEFGVPASILISLSIHETSFGTKGVGKSLHNWFGMMATSLYPTDPSYTGRFEKYPNAVASIRDAARLLGSPKASYKVTNIIINNKGLDGAYDKIARSITAHWCVNEPGKPCSYDAQDLLDTMEQYDLKKYDEQLKKLSVEELKKIINKYYGPNAISIPGYDGVQGGWSGDYADPDTSNNVADGVYFNSSYTGDVTKGYLYQKYAGTDLWENMLLDSDEAKASEVVRSILVQGEELYGDGELHADDFIWNGTDGEPPRGDMVIGDGSPLACYTKITSPFNSQEDFRNSKHKGLDIASPMGTPIYSIVEGVVESTEDTCPAKGEGYGDSCGGGYGNHVKIKGTDGLLYIYAHMKEKPLVSKGNTILKGQQIGLVGSSGSSTGPHLHFEVKKNNVSINPQPYANISLIPICGQENKKPVISNVKVQNVNMKISGLSRTYKIAWVSDAHLIAEEDRKQSKVAKARYDTNFYTSKVHSDEWMQQIVNYINQNHFDAVIFGGDMVDQGTTASINLFKEYYDKINVSKKMYIRSDHDTATDLYGIAGNQGSITGVSNIYSFNLDNVTIIGINNSHSNLSTDAYKQLTNKLSGASNVIIATHVPYKSNDTTTLDNFNRFSKGLNRSIDYYFWHSVSGQNQYHIEGNMESYLNQYVFGSNTKVRQVLAGHMHAIWSGKLNNSGTNQTVFGPAYDGNIGVVTLTP